jgi:hypothetical protein
MAVERFADEVVANVAETSSESADSDGVAGAKPIVTFALILPARWRVLAYLEERWSVSVVVPSERALTEALASSTRGVAFFLVVVVFDARAMVLGITPRACAVNFPAPGVSTSSSTPPSLARLTETPSSGDELAVSEKPPEPVLTPAGGAAVPPGACTVAAKASGNPFASPKMRLDACETNATAEPFSVSVGLLAVEPFGSAPS